MNCIRNYFLSARDYWFGLFVGFIIGWISGCIFYASAAHAACAPSIPAGSIEVIDCNQESIVTNSPYYTLSDATGLPLGFSLAWSNSGTTLVSGVPVSGLITFTNGNPALTWPGHGLAANSFVMLSTTTPNSTVVGTLPANFTGSTFTSQTGYYVIATGLTANNFELSATLGGSAIVPSGPGTAYGFNPVAGFLAASNAVFVAWKATEQQQATAAPTPPAQLSITPAQ